MNTYGHLQELQDIMDSSLNGHESVPIASYGVIKKVPQVSMRAHPPYSRLNYSAHKQRYWRLLMSGEHLEKEAEDEE